MAARLPGGLDRTGPTVSPKIKGRYDVVSNEQRGQQLDAHIGDLKVIFNKLLGSQKKKIRKKKDQPIQQSPNERAWSLKTSGGIIFQSQFPPEGFTLTHKVGGNWEEVSSMGTAHPLLQFTRGTTETFNVKGMLISGKKSDIDSQLKLIQSFVRPDSFSGHPPVSTFTYGTFSIQCIVSSFSNDKMIIQPDGRTRIVNFTLECKKFRTTKREFLNIVNDKFPVWKQVIMKPGDTFELIAKKYYGRADWGDTLRKLNPGVEPVKKPTMIKLPHPTWMAANAPRRSAIFRKNSSKLKKLKSEHKQITTSIVWDPVALNAFSDYLNDPNRFESQYKGKDGKITFEGHRLRVKDATKNKNNKDAQYKK